MFTGSINIHHEKTMSLHFYTLMAFVLVATLNMNERGLFTCSDLRSDFFKQESILGLGSNFLTVSVRKHSNKNELKEG